MIKCKACRRGFTPEEGFTNDEAARRYEYLRDGQSVPESGIVNGCWASSFDLDWYKFTLVPGWYCHECLTAEIRQGLCQPLLIYYRSKSGALDDACVRRYRVRGVGWKDGIPIGSED